MAREVKLILDLDTGRLRSDSRKAARDVDQIDDALSRTERSTNRVQSAWKKFGGVVGALAIGDVIRRGFERAITKGKEFEQQLADLSAITGISGSALQELGDDALDASGEFGTAASDIVEAQKLVASQLAERIDFNTQAGLEQLKEISRQATVLQRAAGIDLSTAVEATTQTINQFNLEAGEAGRVVNVLAAGAKLGAAEVGAQADAFRDAGTAAAGAGISIEETQAAIQRLAAAGIRGQRAGTGLRNIFVRLQTRTEELADEGFGEIDIQANGFVDTLRDLAPLADDAVARTAIFGEEAQQFAQILLQDVDALEDFAEGVTDTDTAIEQATVQLNTFEGTVDRLTTALDEQLIGAFQETGGVMTQTLEGGIALIGVMADRLDEMNERVRTTSTIVSNFSTGSAIDEIGVRLLEQFTILRAFGVELQTANRRFLQAQEEATKGFEKQIDAITLTNSAIAEQRDTLDEDSDAYTELNERIEDNIDLLETDQSTLERVRASLIAARSGVKENSNEYGELTVRITETEKMLRAIGDAIERNIGLRRQAQIEDTEPETAETSVTIRQNFEQGDEIGARGVEGETIGQEEELAGRIERTNAQYMTRAQLIERIGNLSTDVYQREASGLEMVAAAGAEALAISIERGDSVANMARNALKAILAETVALQVRNVVASVPFPLNVALIGLAAATVNRLFDEVVPEFKEGGFTGRTDYQTGGKISGGRRIISVNEDGRSEFIVNADSTQAAPRLISAINDDPALGRSIESSVFGGRESGEAVPTGSPAGGGNVADITRAIERATLRAVVEISELDEKLTDYDELQRTIGNR